MCCTWCHPAPCLRCVLVLTVACCAQLPAYPRHARGSRDTQLSSACIPRDSLRHVVATNKQICKQLRHLCSILEPSPVSGGKRRGPRAMACRICPAALRSQRGCHKACVASLTAVLWLRQEPVVLGCGLPRSTILPGRNTGAVHISAVPGPKRRSCTPHWLEYNFEGTFRSAQLLFCAELLRWAA